MNPTYRKSPSNSHKRLPKPLRPIWSVQCCNQRADTNRNAKIKKRAKMLHHRNEPIQAQRRGTDISGLQRRRGLANNKRAGAVHCRRDQKPPRRPREVLHNHIVQTSLLILVVGSKLLVSANENVIQHSERKKKRGVVTRGFTLRRPHHAPECFDSEKDGHDQRDEHQPQSAEVNCLRNGVCADWLVCVIVVLISSSFFERDGAVFLLDLAKRLST